MITFVTFEEYRDFLIDRGVNECRKLLPEQEGTMKPFYIGTIDEFEHCRQIPDIMEMERRYRELQERLYHQFRDEASLDDYWYTNGRETQAEFLFERLKLLYIREGDIVSARAGIDFHEYLYEKIKEGGVR